jgi:hypothetical protein
MKIYFFCYKANVTKRKKRAERKRIETQALRKRVPIASFLIKSRRLWGGDRCSKYSTLDEAPSLAIKSAHWFPSLRV